MSDNSTPLYLLDGYSLIYRTYFAFINRPLVNSRGENVSILFGFFRTLFNMLDKQGVENLAVVLDSPVPTFRHEMYPLYKANREKAPDDLHSQIPVVLEILELLKVPVLRVDRFEADDIIACMARLCSRNKRPCRIITGDKDLLQLVDQWVKILKPDKEGYLEMGPGEVEEVWGVKPGQILDYLALTGDTSDNIPGVKGIGPKTAAALLASYGDLDGIYGHLLEIPPGQSRKLADEKESAYLSRELVKLAEEVPLFLNPDELSVKNIDKAAAVSVFEREEVHSLAKQIREGLSGPAAGLEKAEDKPAGPEPGGTWTVPPAPEKLNYRAVLDRADLETWMKRCREAEMVSFDCETDNLDEMLARPVGFSLCVVPGEAVYIPLKAEGADCLPEPEVKAALKALLEDPAVKVAGQNIKYDYKVLKRWGVEIANIAFDTMVAAWVLDSQLGQYNMDALALRFLGVQTVHFGDVVEKGKTFDTVPLEKAVGYAAEDADITFRLYKLFSEQLFLQKMDRLYYDLELPLVRILAEMELRGIRILADSLQEYSRELGERLAVMESEIYELCGHEFNISSPKQLQVVLFEERKLKPGKKTKTGYSTDVAVLEELSGEDPVPALILQHRGLSKLKSTYTDALPLMITPQTGRIHTRFIQTGTATGRMSSKDPNLQNIPIKTEDGRRIRSAFVPAPGHIFLSADYSQVELVVLAHLSGDPALSRAFLAKEDVHSHTAALIFDCFPEMVTPEQRRIAKTINFGVMYGMSSYRLSRELQMPRAKADAFIKAYFARYAGIRGFIDATIKTAEETGWITTILGRRREIRGINSRNKTEKAGAERVAVNTPIQGSAADIIKLAMLAVDRRLHKEGLKSRILLQVHDEILLEVPLDEKEAAAALVREEMEKAYTLNVPLKTSLEFGTSWGELH